MSSEERTEEPTDHKLREARRRGEVPVSRDLSAAVSLCAVALTSWVGREAGAERLQGVMADALAAAAGPQAGPVPAEAALRMGRNLLLLVLPLFAAAVLGAMLPAMLQVRGVWSVDPLIPKPERMNPAKFLERLGTGRPWADLLLMLVKTALLLGVLAGCLHALAGRLARMLHGPALASGVQAAGDVALLLACSAGLLLVLGVLDLLYQRHQFLMDQRMTRSEVKREQRDSDGDPISKAHQHALRNALLEEAVPAGGLASAKVVVTNPTHVAVALRYDPSATPLPVVVAKGQGQAARRLREEANSLAIPILTAPPLARRLHHDLAPGQAIRDEHLEAVAEVFRWLEAVRRLHAADGTADTPDRAAERRPDHPWEPPACPP